MSVAGPPFVLEIPVVAAQARKVLRQFLWRRLGGWIVANVLLLGFLVAGWYQPDLRVPAAFLFGMSTMLWLWWYRSLRAVVQDARERERAGESSRFVFDAEGAEWSGSGTTSRTVWANLRRLDRTDTFWVLEFAGAANALPLPSDRLDEPLRSFLEERAREARARVV